MKTPRAAVPHRLERKREAKAVAPISAQAPTLFASQLAQAQLIAQTLAMVSGLKPTVPGVASAPPVPLASRAHPSLGVRARADEPHAASGGMEALVSVEPRRTEPWSAAVAAPGFERPVENNAPRPVAAPPPVWLPHEVVADDTARLALLPHHVSFSHDGQALSMQVRNGEVSLRAQGELSMSLRSSEAELRVALAQQGLRLRETERAATDTDERGRDEERRRSQERGAEEWT